MFTMLIGAGLNTILDPVFIYAFGWGIKGAAYATILSQAVSAAWVLLHFLGGHSLLKVHLRNLKLRLPIVLKILAIGSAPFAMQLAASVLTAIMNKSLRIYGGDIAISGMGVVNSITMLILMPIFGINQGAQPIIGYNYGARKYHRARETLLLAICAATFVVVIGFIMTRLIPEQLIALFNRDPELLRFGTRALKIYLVMLPIIGFQIASSNYFQAVGKPAQSMFLSLSRQVVILIPALLILPRIYGLDGILYAGPLSDLVSSIVTAIWLYIELRHLGLKHAEVSSQP
jgi:Na+-driven multidrug efflux pump